MDEIFKGLNKLNKATNGLDAETKCIIFLHELTKQTQLIKSPEREHLEHFIKEVV